MKGVRVLNDLTGWYNRLAASAIAFLSVAACEPQDSTTIDERTIAYAQRVIGLEFTDPERRLMLEDLEERLQDYAAVRSIELPNETRPSLYFRPVPGVGCQGGDAPGPEWASLEAAAPSDPEQLAFLTVAELARLIRARQITATELTRFFLSRLKRYPELLAVVTLTEERALRSAARADEEIQAGRIRGPLHGIPYGVKDLFAVQGYPTTWGAAPFREQVVDETATVVQKLDRAGAVLVAKLSLGALAWGDVWYGGQTKNPWNLEEGSSGSSAGSASAIAAGLVPFALGTETWGSIVSPASRVGVTGLRPTFGRVSRHGAMSLSWSMDKVGVLCRAVEDCAMVFETIRGCDEHDPSTVEAPFEYTGPADLKSLRVGYLKSEFELDYDGRSQDIAALRVLENLGAELIAVELPELPVEPLALILSVEAAAAFDELTRSNADDLLVRQERRAWPNALRAARLIPAVEYVQANRIRQRLIDETRTLFSRIDIYVAPSTAGSNLLLTNLTGHPLMVVPTGFTDPNSPTSISFVGRYFDEATLLGVAKTYQDATGFHRTHPAAYSGQRKSSP